ncbi:NUDIX domain-containing protein [Streptomyces sp. NPDC001492]
MNSDGRWHKRASRILFAGGPNNRIRLAVDEAVRPDGTTVSYPHVVAPDSVRVLAVRRGQVAVVSQQHYLHDAEITDLPGGMVEEAEKPVDAARRELAEETGIEAGWLYPLATVVTARAVTTEKAHLFLAHGCTQGPASLDAGEALRTQWRSWHELEQTDVMALLSGTPTVIADAASLAAIQRTAVLLRAVGGALPLADDDLPRAAWAAYTALTGLDPFADHRLGMVWLDLALGRTAQGQAILTALETAWGTEEFTAAWDLAAAQLAALAQTQ